MSRPTLLIGKPGSGKTFMACLTSIRRPVHVLDIDRKLKGIQSLTSLFASGELTSWELSEPLINQSLRTRVANLFGDQKDMRTSSAPTGYLKFAEMCDRLDKDENAKRAGTIVIDSGTRIAEHMRAHMTHVAGKTKLNWDMWASWLQANKELYSILIDYANENDKDLIVTIHERVSDEPGKNVKSVIKSKDAQGNITKEYVGQLDIRYDATIDGQFGGLLASYFTEVYHLYVEINKEGKPEWKCRVKPDGKRNLRTSFNVTSEVMEPDFRKIWR